MMATDPTEDDPVCVNVTLTFADYLRFVGWSTFRRLFFLVVIAFFSLGFFLAAPMLSQGDSVGEKYLNSAPSLILPAIVFVLLPVIGYLGARKAWGSAEALREPT